jgi:hypothetical protein
MCHHKNFIMDELDRARGKPDNSAHEYWCECLCSVNKKLVVDGDALVAAYRATPQLSCIQRRRQQIQTELDSAVGHDRENWLSRRASLGEEEIALLSAASPALAVAYSN